MTLLEILGTYEKVTLGIYNDMFYTTIDDVQMNDIKDNKEIRVLTGNTFFTLYINRLDFDFHSPRNEYTAQYKDTTIFIQAMV